VYVCLSACMSPQKPHIQISRKFLYMSPVAMAWSSSYDIAIHYVLPVLWMTSCFHIMESLGQNQSQHCFVKFGCGITGVKLLSMITVLLCSALI